jgi:hypothetical protein
MKYIINERQYRLLTEDTEIEPSKSAIKNICDTDSLPEDI